jgi:Ca-activated chloride channel family protein
MRWAEPERLILLWLAVALLLLAVWAVRRRKRLESTLGDPTALRRLTGEAGGVARAVRMGLFLLAFAFAVAGLARPLAGFRLVTTAARGADVVVALDLSHSMEARDIRPDRLRAAEREVATLLKALEGSSMGLVAFAGEAKVISPLSTDLQGLVSMVETARPADLSEPGSDIGAAVSLAAKLLRRPGQRPRAVVLVSDGENLSGDAMAGAGAARQAGARLFAIGIGTPEGAPIPMVDSTGALVGERRGPDGKPVQSRLDEGLLRQLARRGAGRYERGDGSGRAALHLADAIRSEGGKEVRGQTIRAYDERFPWFAAAAGLLLLAERAIPRRRKR